MSVGDVLAGRANWHVEPTPVEAVALMLGI